MRLLPYIHLQAHPKDVETVTIKHNTVKPAQTGPPIYRKPGQKENKFRNGVISYVK